MRKQLRLVSAAALCAAGLSLGAAASARPFTAKDMATLERVSDPRLSPDGHWVLYGFPSADRPRQVLSWPGSFFTESMRSTFILHAVNKKKDV